LIIYEGNSVSSNKRKAPRQANIGMRSNKGAVRLSADRRHVITLDE
jgi:hypothetical protein